MYLFGRELHETWKPAAVTVAAGMGGWAASIWANLHLDTPFWGNLTALVTAMFVVGRILMLFIDVYFKSESSEIKEQKAALKQAQDENDKERARLETERARLEEVLSAKTVAELMEVVDVDKGLSRNANRTDRVQ